MSEKLNIYQKLNNFRASIGAIRKDKTNPFHKSKYADINTILAVITPILSENGLLLYDRIENDKVITRVVNVDAPDEFLESSLPILNKQDMQKVGSNITYARRYNCVSLLSLEQEDDDGNLSAQKSHKQIVAEYLKSRGISDLKTFATFVGNRLDLAKTPTNNPQLNQLITEFLNGSKQ